PAAHAAGKPWPRRRPRAGHCQRGRSRAMPQEGGSAVGLRHSLIPYPRRPPMPIQTRYLFSAAMSVRSDKEALFNEVYDKEHVPALLTVPGVIAVARFKSEPVTMMIGGERKTIVIESGPAYNALYEGEGPAVLGSDAWAKAVEEGRWAEHVRPYTTNRRHVMYRRIS